MARYQDLNVHMSNLVIDEEENDAVVIEGDVDDESNKAPPRRLAGPAKSKWLREEGDADWVVRAGRGNNFAKSGESCYGKDGDQGDQGGNYGTKDQIVQYTAVTKDKPTSSTKLAGLDTFSNPVYGLDEEELIGLNLVERKRMRGGPEVYDIMDIAGGLKGGELSNTKDSKTEAALSGTDCATSSTNVLATLAMQASQPQ
ncbi:hypothetical protein ACET3Z_012535 [Daucus carota]